MLNSDIETCPSATDPFSRLDAPLVLEIYKKS